MLKKYEKVLRKLLNSPLDKDYKKKVIGLYQLEISDMYAKGLVKTYEYIQLNRLIGENYGK